MSRWDCAPYLWCDLTALQLPSSFSCSLLYTAFTTLLVPAVIFDILSVLVSFILCPVSCIPMLLCPVSCILCPVVDDAPIRCKALALDLSGRYVSLSNECGWDALSLRLEMLARQMSTYPQTSVLDSCTLGNILWLDLAWVITCWLTYKTKMKKLAVNLPYLCAFSMSCSFLSYTKTDTCRLCLIRFDTVV